MPSRNANDGSGYSYGYQGSESDDEVSGTKNTYTTHYRMLDVRIARWASTDPVTQPHQSPYTSMDNNPIWFNDVLGNIVDPVDEESGKHYQGLKTETKNIQAKFQQKADEAIAKRDKYDKGSFKYKKFDKKYNEAMENVNFYGDILNEFSDLENSSDVFKIRIGNTSTSKKGGGNLRFNRETNEIDVNINMPNDGTSIRERLAHELKHAYQFINGEIGYSSSGKSGAIIGFDIYDEFEAYKRQQIYAPFESPYINMSDNQLLSFIKSAPSYKHAGRTALSINNTFSLNYLREQEINAYMEGRPPLYITTGFRDRMKVGTYSLPHINKPQGVPVEMIMMKYSHGNWFFKSTPPY